MKTILPIAVIGSLLMSSCASLVAFNAQYNTDVTQPEVVYAAPQSYVAPQSTVTINLLPASPIRTSASPDGP